ncbi:MAG TPA: thiamine diphosphokinase [Capsulimonadaceae bacterium]|nr:thiamine diphosphokinase [Capsulimonadaceae bacterium]
MRINHALIVANGEPPARERLLEAVSRADFVLAADGGANILLAAGVTPNAVLGDFDSLAVPLPDTVEQVQAPDQNHTDLDKSVAYLVELGALGITMTAVTGGRLDHTFGALAVLAKYGRLMPLAILDDFATALLVNGQISLSTSPGQLISLLPLGAVDDVTTTGLKWNLTHESLGPGLRDGTSNVANETEVTICVGAGDLVAYIHHLTPNAS